MLHELENLCHEDIHVFGPPGKTQRLKGKRHTSRAFLIVWCLGEVKNLDSSV